MIICTLCPKHSKHKPSHSLGTGGFVLGREWCVCWLGGIFDYFFLALFAILNSFFQLFPNTQHRAKC